MIALFALRYLKEMWPTLDLPEKLILIGWLSVLAIAPFLLGVFIGMEFIQ